MSKFTQIALVIAAASLNFACTSEQNTKVIQAACIIDGVAQPIVITVGVVAATAAGQGMLAESAASADNKVHPAVQAACAALNGSVDAAKQ